MNLIQMKLRFPVQFFSVRDRLGFESTNAHLHGLKLVFNDRCVESIVFHIKLPGDMAIFLSTNKVFTDKNKDRAKQQSESIGLSSGNEAKDIVTVDFLHWCFYTIRSDAESDRMQLDCKSRAWADHRFITLIRQSGTVKTDERYWSDSFGLYPAFSNATVLSISTPVILT